MNFLLLQKHLKITAFHMTIEWGGLWTGVHHSWCQVCGQGYIHHSWCQVCGQGYIIHYVSFVAAVCVYTSLFNGAWNFTSRKKCVILHHCKSFYLPPYLSPHQLAHTLLLCAVPPFYKVRINATRFVAHILNDTSPGTSIVHFSVIINSTYFGNLQTVSLSITRNTLIEQTFNFIDGTADKIITGFGSVSNSTVIVESSIVYTQIIAVGIYDFVLGVVVVGQSDETGPIIEDLSSLVEVDVRRKYFYTLHVYYNVIRAISCA